MMLTLAVQAFLILNEEIRMAKRVVMLLGRRHDLLREYYERRHRLLQRWPLAPMYAVSEN